MDNHETYKKLAYYYDAYTEGYNRDIPLYLKAAAGRETILELGCGSGRVLAPLLEAGNSVTGMDSSADMLSLAEEKCQKFIENGSLTLKECNIEKEGIEGSWDLILAPFYFFNYILDNPHLFLNKIEKALNPGGVVIMELFYPRTYKDFSQMGQWTEKTISVNDHDVLIKDKRSMDADYEIREQIFTDNDQDIQITTKRRYYFPTEIYALLKQAGLSTVLLGAEAEMESWLMTPPEKGFHNSYFVMGVK